MYVSIKVATGKQIKAEKNSKMIKEADQKQLQLTFSIITEKTKKRIP